MNLPEVKAAAERNRNLADLMLSSQSVDAQLLAKFALAAIPVIEAAERVLEDLPTMYCSDLHHTKKDQHYSDICPVEVRMGNAKYDLHVALAKLREG